MAMPGAIVNWIGSKTCAKKAQFLLSFGSPTE